MQQRSPDYAGRGFYLRSAQESVPRLLNGIIHLLVCRNLWRSLIVCATRLLLLACLIVCFCFGWVVCAVCLLVGLLVRGVLVFVCLLACLRVCLLVCSLASLFERLFAR